MTLTPETIELIESLVRTRWAKAPKQSDEEAEYIQAVAINAVKQCLTDESIIASVKGEEWVNVEDATPTAYHTGNFDGKKSDPVLAEIEFGVYKIGVVYEGYMDGRHFVQWYDENDFEIKTPKRWRNIPL